MYALECVSVAGRAESPGCRCGKKMHSAGIESLPERSDTHIRIYNCPACHHEMRVTVWGADEGEAGCQRGGSRRFQARSHRAGKRRENVRIAEVGA
jgi:hypothetical protein